LAPQQPELNIEMPDSDEIKIFQYDIDNPETPSLLQSINYCNSRYNELYEID